MNNIDLGFSVFISVFLVFMCVLLKNLLLRKKLSEAEILLMLILCLASLLNILQMYGFLVGE